MLERLRRVVTAREPSPLRVIGLSLAATFAAVLARAALQPLLADRAPYVTAFPALLVASLLGGRWAGLLTLLLSGLVTSWVFIPPALTLRLSRQEFGSLLAYHLSGGAVVIVALILRQTLRDLTVAGERERLLVAELQHRVKNNLAIVQSLAAQTARSSGSLAAFLPAFNERLMALARVHNLLVESESAGVDLQTLAGRSLAPFMNQDNRIAIEGPPAGVSAENAVSVALALHELATNAVKHGALSGEGRGRVRLSWSIRRSGDGDEALLEWTERGGPPVAAPLRQGFGSRLLRLGIEGSGRPRVVYDLTPEGVTWRAPVRLQAGR